MDRYFRSRMRLVRRRRLDIPDPGGPVSPSPAKQDNGPDDQKQDDVGLGPPPPPPPPPATDPPDPGHGPGSTAVIQSSTILSNASTTSEVASSIIVTITTSSKSDATGTIPSQSPLGSSKITPPTSASQATASNSNSGTKTDNSFSNTFETASTTIFPIGLTSTPGFEPTATASATVQHATNSNIQKNTSVVAGTVFGVLVALMAGILVWTRIRRGRALRSTSPGSSMLERGFQRVSLSNWMHIRVPFQISRHTEARPFRTLPNTPISHSTVNHERHPSRNTSMSAGGSDVEDAYTGYISH